MFIKCSVGSTKSTNVLSRDSAQEMSRVFPKVCSMCPKVSDKSVELTKLPMSKIFTQKYLSFHLVHSYFNPAETTF